MVDARFAVLALAVGLIATPSPRPAAIPMAPPPAAAAVGSPLICFPIDIGDAASLPFGRDGFAVKTAMKPDEIAATVRTVLGRSGDVTVHMETLRRAAIWLMSMESQGSGPADPQHLNAVKIQLLLTEELLAAASADDDAKRGDAGQARHEALRWFDLGYFLAAGGQARVCEAGASLAYLEKAARLVPDDRALRFGVALGEFNDRGDASSKSWAAHLARLFENPATPDAAVPAALRKNVLSTFGAFLGQDDWDKLGAEVRKHVGRT